MRITADMAKREALTITNHGRPELVVLDAQEYERLRRLDDRVSMPVEALGAEDLARLMKSPIPEETRMLDHLVPDNW